MPDRDPTPTPTPREALASAIARCREYGGTGLDEWIPRVVEAARADERAALAASAGPLDMWQESELNRFIARFEDVEDEATGNCRECHGEVGHELACPIFAVKKLLTDYTALTAQLAAARAERDALREELDNIAKTKPTDWSDIEGDTYYEFYLWAKSRARHTLDRFATPARPTDATPTPEGQG